MDSPFQRARQPAQKALRRAHLVATARAQLASGTTVRTLSLNELARQAGMAKANLYRYFETREALLLALLQEEWQRWFERLRADWSPSSDGPPSLEAVAERLAHSLADETLLCELTAVLPSVLEQNLTEAAITDFKRDTLAMFGAIADFLVSVAPSASPSDYAEVLYDAAHLIMGLYPAHHPSPAAALALTCPDLAFFRRDFRSEFVRMLTAVAARRVG